MNAVKELAGDPNYGLELILCGNHEELGVDSTNLPYRTDEAVDMVLDAGGRVADELGYPYTVDSVHSRWAGGWLGRGQHYMLSSSRAAVRIYQLEKEEDDDGEVTTRWEYCTGRLPQHVVQEALKIQTRVEEAMVAEIVRLEKMAESIAASAPTDDD